MSANQKIILAIFIVYLALNAAIGIIFSNRQNKKQHTSSEKKFFIGGRNMNGLLLAMTTMATYTSVSSFISGPGAAGLTYGYAQAWIATVQVPITFLVLGVLGNKLALVSRRTGAVTVVGYLKARYKSDVLVIVPARSRPVSARSVSTSVRPTWPTSRRAPPSRTAAGNQPSIAI